MLAVDPVQVQDERTFREDTWLAVFESLDFDAFRAVWRIFHANAFKPGAKGVLPIEKLRDLAAPEAAEQAAAVIHDAVADLTDQTRIDEAVADFVRKRRQAEETEKRLRRIISARQDDADAEAIEDLRLRLQASGLSENDWIHLTTKNVTSAEQDSAEGAAEASSGGSVALSILLMQLVERLEASRNGRSPPLKSEQIAPIVERLQEGMASTVADTRRKMDGLQKQFDEIRPLHEVSQPEDIARQAYSRKRIIVMLAEIVQELCQPLSVIIATIEMVCKGQLGDVPDIQKQMLEMALENGQRIGELVQALATISGMPATLQPDSELLGQIYRR